MLRRARLPLVLAAALVAASSLAGCVEVEEALVLDGDGGGTYDLTVTWDADLWRRVGDVLGPAVLAHLQGRAFPLRVGQVRDGLEGLPGLTVLEVEEGPAPGGRRTLRIRLRFETLQALLGWEVLARRTLRVEAVEGAEPAACRFTMEPIARVPLLDRLGALLDAIERPPPAPEGVPADRDPPPLERLGLERGAAEMVWRMAKQPLEASRLRFRVSVPSDLDTLRGRPVAAGTREAVATFDFAALRRTSTDRTLQFTWTPRAFDRVPLVAHVGDADPRARRPDGTRR